MHSTSFSTNHFSIKEGREPDILGISAVEHLRRMRGGSQSHLMRCSDGKLYVVKFLNNPQHARVLANEVLGTRLARLVGLPVPRVALVWVDHSLIRNTPALTVCLVDKRAPCQAGLQFGSEYAIDPLDGRIFDDFPTELLGRVRNLSDFAGMLAFDKWTGNVDDRQATFWRKGRQKKYTATFIDQGHCFNGGNWTFSDKQLGGCYCKNEVYLGVQGWQSFEPWLSRIETMDFSIWTSRTGIPPEWSIGIDELACLLTALNDRRSIVRDLIHNFRISRSMPFPNWQ